MRRQQRIISPEKEMGVQKVVKGNGYASGYELHTYMQGCIYITVVVEGSFDTVFGAYGYLRVQSETRCKRTQWHLLYK